MSGVIRVRADNAEEELHSFCQWLRDEPYVRLHAVIMLVSPGLGGPRQAGMSDVVKLVIDSEFQILNFGRAYVAWRATRGAASSLTVERDGVGVTLDDGDPEVVARMVRAIGQ